MEIKRQYEEELWGYVRVQQAATGTHVTRLGAGKAMPE